MFVNIRIFHPSLIFAGQTRSLSLGAPVLSANIRIGVEDTDIDKHASLLQQEINYDPKSFIEPARGLFFSFRFVPFWETSISDLGSF